MTSFIIPGAGPGVGENSMLDFLARLARGDQTRDSEAARIAKRPDRVVLCQTVLPAFTAFHSVLWVGCRAYTKAYYPVLESQGGVCWTLEIDPAAAEFGNGARHEVGDLTTVDKLFGGESFQAILCNGVLGWGVDSPAQQTAALQAMAAILEPNGVLLLGWNTHKVADPVGLAAPWFERHHLPALPTHIAVANSTHRYDLLKKIRRDA